MEKNPLNLGLPTTTATPQTFFTRLPSELLLYDSTFWISGASFELNVEWPLLRVGGGQVSAFGSLWESCNLGRLFNPRSEFFVILSNESNCAIFKQTYRLQRRRKKRCHSLIFLRNPPTYSFPSFLGGAVFRAPRATPSLPIQSVLIGVNGSRNMRGAQARPAGEASRP